MAAVGTAALTWHQPVRAAGANERITLGLIGPGGMGTNLLKSFAGMDDVAIAYVCDPDANRLEAAAKVAESLSGKRPQAVKDLRRVLESKEVDAVVIATPDHWHAPATILACDAGKHVYVEKPCSHNLREGRLMVEAARAAGTDSGLGPGLGSKATTVAVVDVFAWQPANAARLSGISPWSVVRRLPGLHQKRDLASPMDT